MLYEQIYKRKSVRTFNNKKLSEEVKNKIFSVINELKLYNNKLSTLEIKLLTYDEFASSAKLKIIPKSLLIKSPYYISIYKNGCEDPYVNAGFCGEELILALEEMGLKTCWVGSADPFGKSDNFIIGIAVGYSDTKDTVNRKRNDINTYFTGRCTNLEIVKALWEAPSARNSQPIKLSFKEDKISVFYKDGLRTIMKYMHKVDMGIALKHLSLTLEKEKIDFSIEASDKDFDIILK